MGFLRTTATSAWLVIFLIFLGLFGTGCNGPMTTPSAVIKEPGVIEPLPPIAPGAQVNVGIEVSASASVSYQWETDGRGEIISDQTRSAITWQAPQEPGLYSVFVKVTINGVETEKSVAIEVVGTPIAAVSSSPTPIQTPSPAPSTDTSTPTETPLPPPDGVIKLNPADFEPQDGNKGDKIEILDEFMLVTRHGAGPKLPAQNGVDLSNYDLEFTFRGGDGKKVQLWYKGQNWANVYSCSSIITSNQSIRFNPVAADCLDMDEFDDFTHIWAIGAKVFDGVEGVTIVSVRLIDREVNP